MTKFALLFTGLGLATTAVFSAEAPAGKPVITVGSDSLRVAVGANAHTLEFTDKFSGANYCTRNPSAAFARVKKAGRFFEATTAALTDGRLVLEFGGAGVKATLKVVGAEHSVTMEVHSVTGDGVEEFVFAEVPLTLKGAAEEPFAACALALNLQTNVREIPGASGRLLNTTATSARSRKMPVWVARATASILEPRPESSMASRALAGTPGAGLPPVTEGAWRLSYCGEVDIMAAGSSFNLRRVGLVPAPGAGQCQAARTYRENRPARRLHRRGPWRPPAWGPGR